ncbi:MAG: FAD-dependent oxidoreductase [Prolixibacteraceae bacterium]|nr:FAD-dependent oxidoreductase [Prolixibacteraceae bacterium]
MNREMNFENKKVAIIGGGVAGLSVATMLKRRNVEVRIFEKEEKAGGRLQQWHCLFPDSSSSEKLAKELINDAADAGVSIVTKTKIEDISNTDNRFRIVANGHSYDCDAVILANGFSLFDAALKEEYGYGIYNRVITSAELESRMHNPDNALNIDGETPGRVAFVHCVGSRDAKVGNHYCSKVCCITGVKQAINIKKMYPGCEVTNFYMDLRMFGMGYEELYREAQEKYGVNFIRGRVSESSQIDNNSIQIKAEDTLLGRTIKMNVDWLILLVGIEPCTDVALIATRLGLEKEPSGFLSPNNRFSQSSLTVRDGVFLAGSCIGPASIPDTISHAKATALTVIDYLSK